MLKHDANTVIKVKLSLKIRFQPQNIHKATAQLWTAPQNTDSE